MRPILTWFLSVLISPVPQLLVAAQSPQIDTNAVYRLFNVYAGPLRSLTVSRSGNTNVIGMTDTTNSLDQLWKLVPLGNGKYRLINLAAGDGQSLDTPMNGNRYVLVMADTGNYSGQIWSVTSGNGGYRLTNDYAGPGKSIDTPMSGNQYVPVMADTGNYSGQVWMLMPAALPVAQIDTNSTYLLTNDSAAGKALTASNSGAIGMADVTSSPEQLWKVVPLGNGKYRLINLATGDGKSLDTPMSGIQYVIVMANSGNYTGQIWTLTPFGNGKYRLTNDYAGPGKSIDTPMSGNQYVTAMANTGYYSGQVWTLTKSSPAVAAPPAPAPGPVTSAILSSSGRLTVTGLPTWDPRMIPNKGGTLLCSATATRDCGPTKADWIGSHTLNLNCAKGFYDPIWGGTCWDYPPDDRKGRWIRTLDPVTSDTAIARMSVTNSAAQKVKTTPWAWECPSGSFWDPINGGECWKCPAENPTRTIAPIYANNACGSNTNETRPAVFLNYNGCPKPEPAKMGLVGKRMPGKPFLHVGSGCYACPTADEEGNILVTERNANPITGNDYANNKGCTIIFKWKPPEFPEPGLSGLSGVKAILAENMIFDNPDILTVCFTKVAEDRGLKAGTPESIQFVTQQWQELASNPYKSATLANLLFGFLEVAAGTDAASRTPAEQQLVAAMEQYVKVRRTFVAEQALAMYDAWKANDDAMKNSRPRSRLEVIGFDYGTVPLDFQSAVMAGFGLGAAGVGTVTAIVGANRHVVETARIQREAAADARSLQNILKQAKTAEEVRRINTDLARVMSTAARTQKVSKLFEGVRAFRTLSLVSRVGLLAGSTAIELVGSILISIAIDQFIQIVEARPKLLEAVEKAKQPVDLRVLLAQANGKDELAYYWSKAMDAKSVEEDGQVVAAARAAMEQARQRGYQFSGQ